MKFTSVLVAPLLAMALACGGAAAHEGHDHGDEAPAAPAGPAVPRFESHSDLFEVVGMLEGEELIVYVDRYADNAPVLKATVELESGTLKSSAEFREQTGVYAFAGAAFANAGSYPVTLTITAEDEIDILAANLVVAGEHGDHEEHEHEGISRTWIAGGLLALLLLSFAAHRLLKRRGAGGAK